MAAHFRRPNKMERVTAIVIALVLMIVLYALVDSYTLQERMGGGHGGGGGGHGGGGHGGGRGWGGRGRRYYPARYYDGSGIAGYYDTYPYWYDWYDYDYMPYPYVYPPVVIINRESDMTPTPSEKTMVPA